MSDAPSPSTNPAGVAERFRLSRREALHLAVVVIAIAAAIGHQVSLWDWFIEDAAISFAYAKHLAEGDGLVSWVGGERVEGYSNPTWTFFLAALHWVGFDLFEVVKWVQVFQTAFTVVVSYFIGREAFHDRPNNPAVLLVPCFVAANAQFAIWGGAGLENGMLNLFIALAIWRLLVEARTGSFPWSALLWLLVALTRPESITYAAVGGFLSMVFHLAEGRGLKRTFQWVLLFWPPFLVYHWVRYLYFAWPFPNTYYAKLDHRAAPPGTWGRRPWAWSQRWAHELGHGYLMPVYLFGILGHGKAWRYLVVAALLLLVGGSIELADNQRWLLPVVLGATYIVFSVGLTWGRDEDPPRALVGAGLAGGILLFGASEFARFQYGFEPNVLPTPDRMDTFPPYLLVGGALLAPLLSIGSPGWRARVTTWAMCFAAAFFAVWAEFDWMKGYRWYATAAVPGSVLLALGTDSMVHALGTWTRVLEVRAAKAGAYVFAVALLAGFATVHGVHTKQVAEKPDARPQGVRSRVRFVESVRKRLFVDDEKWKDLDVDQGAHLYWSDFAMLDIAGLVDVPMGHQKFERAFIREYLFQEERPHFAHVHGAWANTSKIPSHPEWRRDYVEIPGFPVGGGKVHIGNHVRKDLLVLDASPFPVEHRRLAAKGLVFEGFSIPVDPGKARAMYVEVGVRKLRSSKAGNVRLLMAVKGPGGMNTFDLPLGYDWWMPEDWTAGKMFHGKFGVPLPAHLKPGTYDVAFVMLDEDGSVLPLTDPTPDAAAAADAPEPLLARGEAQFPGALTLLTADARSEWAKAKRLEAIEVADGGRCQEAREMWWSSKRARPLDDRYVTDHAPTVNRHLAACFVGLVATTDDLEEQLEYLERARYYDPRNADVYRVGAEVGAPLATKGLAHYQEGLAACADVAPSAQGLLARFLATVEDYRELGECHEEQKEHWEAAYQELSRALRADPTDAWSRRYAEEVRSLRLGIGPAHKAMEQAERAERKASAERRRKEYEDRKKERANRRPDDEAEEQDKNDKRPKPKGEDAPAEADEDEE